MVGLAHFSFKKKNKKSPTGFVWVFFLGKEVSKLKIRKKEEEQALSEVYPSREAREAQSRGTTKLSPPVANAGCHSSSLIVVVGLAWM